MARATTQKTTPDRIKQNKKDTKIAFAMGRQIKSGVSSSSVFGSGQGSGGSIDTSGNFLQTAGGTMIGPIAFFPQPISVLSDSIDISINAGNYSSYVIALGQGSAADNLSKIVGAQFSGQELIIQATATTPITLKDIVTPGNIHLPGGTDVLIPGLDAVTLVFDSTQASGGRWILSTKSGGTGSVTFPITPTVHDYGSIGGGTQNLNLSLSDGHVHKFTLTGNETLTFSNPPASGTQMTFEVEVKQDATGGRTLTWPSSVIETVTISLIATEVTIITVRTNDGGTTYHAIPALRGTISLVGGGGGTTWTTLGPLDTNIVPDTTAIRNLGSTTKFMSNLYTGTLNLGDGTDIEVILGVPTGLEYKVLTGDSHLFKVNNISKFQIHGSANVTYQSIVPDTAATKDIGDTSTYFANLFVGTVNFGDNANNETIIGVPTGLEYNVKSGDTHSFRISAAEKLNIDNSGLHINNFTIFDIAQLQFHEGHTITDGVDALAIGVNTNDDITLNTTNVQVEVDGDTNSVILRALASASASDGMFLDLNRVDVTPIDGDTMGSITFSGKNEAVANKIYCQIDGIGRDVSTATEDGEVWFFIQKAGTLTSQFVISAGKVSTQGGNVDFAGGDIINLDDISFNVPGTTILNYVDGLDFNVPTGDFYRYFINASLIFDVKTTGIKMNSTVGLDIDLNGNNLLKTGLVKGAGSGLAYIDMNSSAGSIYIDTGQTGKNISLVTNGVIQISVSDTQILTSLDILVTTGKNIVFDTGTGSKIGTGTTQKIGFWNHAPVIQQTVGSDTLANLYTALRASGIIG